MIKESLAIQTFALTKQFDGLVAGGIENSSDYLLFVASSSPSCKTISRSSPS